MHAAYEAGTFVLLVLVHEFKAVLTAALTEMFFLLRWSFPEYIQNSDYYNFSVHQSSMGLLYLPVNVTSSFFIQIYQTKL